jgi:hypothetical protein
MSHGDGFMNDAVAKQRNGGERLSLYALYNRHVGIAVLRNLKVRLA